MPDIIQLLPDHIANQIAAGEVIQRPASAVKELLENAVDAGATKIQLLIEEAGKTLIQVIDNGKGMSETDARMSFERHATSKIQTIEDLFKIRTMGFRGEALASIAAVAKVEMKTRKASDALGVYIELENSTVIKQEPCHCEIGTTIRIKNLFFNVPARRNFLKSNATEMRHIMDEFQRVALAFPNISFTLKNNNQAIFHLDGGSLKQRIIQLLGNHLNSKLVSVQENTDYMNITGFIGKPDVAKKTRGDQYFFVNNRFIKSAYLNHAVASAYKNLILVDSFPTYILCIDLDASHIDINVHPTKQEIKFEDEKIIYAFLQSAIKHALATFSITPTIDFDLDKNIQQLDAIQQPFTDNAQRAATKSSLFKTFTQKNQAHFIEKNNNELKNWKSFFEPSNSKKYIDQHSDNEIDNHTNKLFSSTTFPNKITIAENATMLQIANTFILVPTVQHGFIVVHQQLAHERILYERLTEAITGKPIAIQKTMFPVTFDVSASDSALLQELLPDLISLGYQIEFFGKNSFVIQGTPADVSNGQEKNIIETLLDQFKHFSSELKLSKREKIIRSMAKQQTVPIRKTLTVLEMEQLIQHLFQCTTPNMTIAGKPTYIEFKADYLEQLFEK